MVEKSCLYVIELEPGKDPEAKWYVGISKNPDHRIGQHQNSGGSEWTRRNKVVGAYKISWHPTKHVRKKERHLTALLMDAYGMDSTRGAKYLSPDLLSRPPTETDHMPPEMSEGLRNSGNAELARVASKPRIYVSIQKEFRSTEEASQWAKENIKGRVEMDMEFPIDPRTFTVDWDPDKIEE